MNSEMHLLKLLREIYEILYLQLSKLIYLTMEIITSKHLTIVIHKQLANYFTL